ncbi:MAG: MGMT family protein, partial [Sphingomonas sp.]
FEDRLNVLATWRVRAAPLSPAAHVCGRAHRRSRRVSRRCEACGANPIAILIPCHRALRTDGTLGGYAYGLDRKRALLAKEAPREPALSPAHSGDPRPSTS